jgi:Polysaccharide deacetylase
MKTITYHYVRQRNAAMPSFIYLDQFNFELQLKYFQSNGGMVSRSEFLSLLETGRLPQSKYLLTFDDGLIEHEFVANKLRSYDALGLFYISTGPLSNGKSLGVHITHALLGCVKPETILASIGDILAIPIQTALQDRFENTYSSQDSPAALTQVKRLLNYQIPFDQLDFILDELCRLHMPDAKQFAFSQYLNHAQIKKMEDIGMIIGAHSVSHKSLARLPEARWKAEISESLSYVDKFKDRSNPLSFAYPYGGAHSYAATAQQFLTEQKCEFAFDINARDTTDADLVLLRQALPRFDCNQFPHGKASGVVSL